MLAQWDREERRERKRREGARKDGAGGRRGCWVTRLHSRLMLPRYRALLLCERVVVVDVVCCLITPLSLVSYTPALPPRASRISASRSGLKAYTLCPTHRTRRHPSADSPLSVGDVKQLPAICARAGVELLRATGVTTHRCTSFPLQNPAARAGYLNRLVNRDQLSMLWMCLLWRRATTCLLW